MDQQILNAIFIGSIYALFAVGYTLVFGVLDILNLAHSAVFMLGAAVTYSLTVNHGLSLLGCVHPGHRRVGGHGPRDRIRVPAAAAAPESAPDRRPDLDRRARSDHRGRDRAGPDRHIFLVAVGGRTELRRLSCGYDPEPDLACRRPHARGEQGRDHPDLDRADARSSAT